MTHLQDWFDRLLASDPDLSRLRASARALLIALVGAGVLLGAARLLGLPAKAALIGVVVPMMSAVIVQDAARGEQRVTLWLMPLVATPAIWLGTWLADRPWWSGAAFVAIIVAGFEARRLGPRGTGLGTVAYLSYFYALLLKPDPGSELVLLGFLLAGTAIANALLAATQERPAALVRHQLRALRSRVALLLSDLVAALDMPDPERAAGRAQRQVAPLNGLSLTLDGRLDQVDPQRPDPSGGGVPALRDLLLQTELCAETLASLVEDQVRHERPGDPGRAAMRRLLVGLHEAVRSGATLDRDRLDADVQATPGDADQRWRLRRAACELLEQPAWREPLPPLRDEPRPPAPSAGGGATSPRHRWFALDQPTRQAIQGAVAAAGAGLAGYAISAQHWYWAVFAAFVVFTRVTSVGQTLAQAWKGIVANAGGVALGFAVAELVQGHTVLQLALLFVFVAAGFYAYRGLQAAYTMLLTAMLSMLYELLGKYTPGLLLVRLEETLAGAAIALVSGLLVFPVRTQDHSDRESTALLHEAARVLRETFHASGAPDSLQDVRALDRELQSLRGALGPVAGAGYGAAVAPHRRRLQLLGKLVYCLRHLRRLVGGHQGLRRDAALVAQAEEVASQLDAATSKPHDSGSARPGDSRHDGSAGVASGDGSGDAQRRRLATHWLEQADAIARSLGTAPR